MRTASECSAGGVITRAGSVLLIRVRTLKGELAWTYPKGRLEPGETSRAAALREVREESGYECAIRRALPLVRYNYLRAGRLIRKRVRWYWMEPLRRVGKPDANEVLGLRWVPLAKAEALLRYPADIRALTRVRTWSA